MHNHLGCIISEKNRRKDLSHKEMQLEETRKDSSQFSIIEADVFDLVLLLLFYWILFVNEVVVVIGNPTW